MSLSLKDSAFYEKSRISLLSPVLHSLWLQIYSWHPWMQRPFDCISPPHILLSLLLLFTLSAIEAVSLLAGHLSQPIKSQKRVESFLLYKSGRDCFKGMIFFKKWLQLVLLFGCKENPKYSFGFNIACMAQILIYWKKTLCMCMHACYSIHISWVLSVCQVIRLDGMWLRVTVTLSALNQFTVWIKQTSHVWVHSDIITIW